MFDINPKFSVVIPVYNEEEVIEESYMQLKGTMEKSNAPFELIFVNDGSSDNSLSLLKEISGNDKAVKIISFSRNFGHQAAITAGMDYSQGDAIAIIDADLQDPPMIILEMIKEWEKGYEIVYGKRKKRTGETVFKKFTASLYYRFLRKMTETEIPVDTGDFRLIDRKVCNAMKSLTERNRYVRGLVSWVGFKQTYVEYERNPRFAGETKYPLKKMIKLAMDGITSFSYKPLKLATTIGFIFSVLSFVYMLVVLYKKLFTDTTITGWSSTVVILLFTQGIVLMVLGLIGEYMGRIYDEIKGRPIYIVDTILGYEEVEK